MYIADALACKQWSDLVNLEISEDFIKYDMWLEVEKQKMWCEIKVACAKGKYSTSYFTYYGDKVEQLAIIFRGYGYKVDIKEPNSLYISWKDGNND